jgi:RNA polymerase sigma factor (sigma-70 family)
MTDDTNVLFGQIREAYGGLIRASVRKLVTQEDWDDVEATIYVSIWTALKRFDGRSSLKTYIYPIVRRRIADHFREKYKEAKLIKKAKEELCGEVLEVEAEDAPAIETLSPAEIRVFRCLADGRQNAEIAKALFLSIDTVRSHLKGIYKKTKSRDRAALVLLAYRFWKENT